MPVRLNTCLFANATTPAQGGILLYNETKVPGYLGLGNEKLPNYVGIII